jgi:hypothetical protein
MRMARRRERSLIGWAVAASVAVHALALAIGPAEPPKRPRYVVLETRLELAGAPGAGRLMTAQRPLGRPTEAAAGGQSRQSATPEQERARIAMSPLTLPHAFKQEKRFEAGDALAEREKSPGIPAMLPPSLTTYFRASELDAVAVPQFAANLDLDFLRFTGAAALRVRIFINEAGGVDEVTLDDQAVPVAMHEQVRAAFLALRFHPAQKDGFLVKSQKLVEVLPVGDDASSS